MSSSKKSKYPPQKDKVTTKPKSRSKSKRKRDLSKILILILSLVAIGGVVYVVYDIIQNNRTLVSEQNYITQVWTNNPTLNAMVSNTNYVKTNSKSLEMSNVVEKTQESFEKKKITNSVSIKKDSVNEEDSKVDVKRVKIYYYRVSGDNLVFSSRQVDLNGDSLYEVFKTLKQIKNSDNEVSFVNKRVRIIDYRVVDDTLIINLSREIEINEYGSIGVLYSIYQIAYSLGSITRSKNVLVLIEGTKPNYIEGEGIVFQNPIDITRLPAIN
ncbi:MAG: GerMN domain-containing protein [Spirochaetia bacterium]|nr:GerMN domain-containing protein [Spirochaetota bacterium]MCX8097353.1 GerMN domain-containing protein [Spirochaetota bacterium]MDW8112008.1 GerMN domain-containing protein [Spirochaetia bacterium]